MSTPAEILFDQVAMEPIEGAGETLDCETPYATHRGVLKLGDAELHVYQLNTGERVIDQNDFLKFLGIERA